MVLTKEDLQVLSELIDSRLEEGLRPIRDDVAELKKDVAGLKKDVAGLKTEVAELKTELAELKAEVKGLRVDVDRLKKEMAEVQSRLTLVELHLENETDKNIRILAENHLTLIDKLNEGIKAANKSALYEIKVDYLTEEMEKLRGEVELLKTKIA